MSNCKQGLDDLHRQLYEDKNHLLTRRWLKELLFWYHYSVNGCGYKAKGIHGEGLGTGLPHDGDYSDIELRMLDWIENNDG